MQTVRDIIYFSYKKKHSNVEACCVHDTRLEIVIGLQ